MKSMLLVQQKQNEYIMQLASKVDVLTIYNMMLEDQIAQQATSSTTPPVKFLVSSSLILVSSVTMLP